MSNTAFEDSLLAISPEVAKEWHPTKNGELTAADVHNGSSRIVWWLCSKGHEYQKTVGKRTKRNQGCPICRLEEKSLRAKHPEVIRYWDFENNGEITPDNCFSGSDYVAAWICDQGHQYRMRVASKSRGAGCPICSNQVLFSDNCLAVTEPWLAAEWHPTKNCNLTPYDVMRASHTDVWWQCARGHEWYTPIYSRLVHGCPICDAEKRTSFPEQAILYYFSQSYSASSREKVNGWEIDVYVPELKIGVEYDGHYFHSNTKSAEREDRKNKALDEAGVFLIRIKETKDFFGVKDNTIYCRYSQTYSFIDEVIQSIKNIVFEKMGIELQISSNIEKDRIAIQEQYLLHEKENSLASKRPLAAQKWDYERNGSMTPDMVSAVSKRRYWWKCPSCGNTWQGAVENVTEAITCARCVHASVNVNDLDHYSLVSTFPEIAKDWNFEKNKPISPHDVTPGSNLKVWWRCHICGNEWQTTVKARTRHESHCSRCSQEGRINTRIKNRGSFGSLHPELLDDWDEVKNVNLTPFDITETTRELYWRKCSSGHSYEMAPLVKSRGTGCPICSGKRVVRETSLGSLFPDILCFWDYDSNKSTPYDVAPKSGKVVNWKCPQCGHQFAKRVYVMQKSCSCPSCNHKIR